MKFIKKYKVFENNFNIIEDVKAILLEITDDNPDIFTSVDEHSQQLRIEIGGMFNNSSQFKLKDVVDPFFRVRDYLGEIIHEIWISKNNKPAFRLNLTHSNELMAAEICSDRIVGIRIMAFL